MRRSCVVVRTAMVLAVGVLAGMFPAHTGFAQPPGGAHGGPGFRGGRGDPTFAADRDGFHFLLANHDQIQRQVTQLPDGVETVTESDDPEITAKIQEHVAAMYARVEEGRPIRMRDPLFRELFRHTRKIEMKLEETEKGIRVSETSQDPIVARLIQEHARVVSLFVENGFEEAHRNHAVPSLPAPDALDGAGIPILTHNQGMPAGETPAVHGMAAGGDAAASACCGGGQCAGCQAGGCMMADQAARPETSVPE